MALGSKCFSKATRAPDKAVKAPNINALFNTKSPANASAGCFLSILSSSGSFVFTLSDTSSVLSHIAPAIPKPNIVAEAVNNFEDKGPFFKAPYIAAADNINNEGRMLESFPAIVFLDFSCACSKLFNKI